MVPLAVLPSLTEAEGEDPGAGLSRQVSKGQARSGRRQVCARGEPEPEPEPELSRTEREGSGEGPAALGPTAHLAVLQLAGPPEAGS